jgi:hypothetical protein
MVKSRFTKKYSRFFNKKMLKRNILGPEILVGSHRMSENSGVGTHRFHCIMFIIVCSNWQHKLFATLSANVDINYHFSIKIYYCIYTVRHIRFGIGRVSHIDGASITITLCLHVLLHVAYYQFWMCWLFLVNIDVIKTLTTM